MKKTICITVCVTFLLAFAVQAQTIVGKQSADYYMRTGSGSQYGWQERLPGVAPPVLVLQPGRRPGYPPPGAYLPPGRRPGYPPPGAYLPPGGRPGYPPPEQGLVPGEPMPPGRTPLPVEPPAVRPVPPGAPTPPEGKLCICFGLWVGPICPYCGKDRTNLNPPQRNLHR